MTRTRGKASSAYIDALSARNLITCYAVSLGVLCDYGILRVYFLRAF